MVYVTRPHNWRIRVACEKIENLLEEKTISCQDFVSIQKPVLQGKVDAAMWHTLWYVTERSISYLWRGRLECLTLSWDIFVYFFLLFSPKPSLRWLTSMWNSDCSIVWNWYAKYHIHMDQMLVWESTCVHYTSAYTNHVTRLLRDFHQVGMVLPVVS